MVAVRKASATTANGTVPGDRIIDQRPRMLSTRLATARKAGATSIRVAALPSWVMANGTDLSTRAPSIERVERPAHSSQPRIPRPTE